MTDKYSNFDHGLDFPANGAFAITPSDSTVFSQPTRGLWIGSSGNIAVRFIDGTSATLSGAQTGTLIPVRVDKVMSTNTTASSIVGLY